MTQKILWSIMTVLAFLIAGYALAMTFFPGIRNPIINEMFIQAPLSTVGHFLGGGISLAIGTIQLNSRLRVRFLNMHRWFGRVYLVAVLAGGLAALNLSVNSSSGFSAQVGFGSLGICWITSTLFAYYFIRNADHSKHQLWMIRSYALTFAAVTLRIYLPAASIAEIPFEDAYIAISWFAWVPNLIIVEWFILPMFFKKALAG